MTSPSGAAQGADWVALAPLLLAAGTALAVLMADLVLPVARRGALVWISLAGCLGALGASLALAGQRRATFCTPPTTLPGGLDVGTSCSYVIDGTTVYAAALLSAAAALALLLSPAYLAAARLPVGEYCFLLLCSLTGMLALAGARDLVSLVVALETLSLPVYVLAGLRRGDSRSAESALKFFLVSVVSTAVMLLGMSLLYGLTGTVHFDRLATALAAREDLRALTLTGAAVALVLVGFGFKISAAPFHLWAPDTYSGAPVPVAAFLSVASKAAGFAGLLLVVLVAFRPYADVWGPLLAALAAVSMTVGNLVALRQSHIVRLLAWSSVAQAGYLLAPLGVAATATGRSDEVLNTAAAATLAYLAIYAAMNYGAFACVLAVGRGTGRNAIEDYRGLARRSPWLAVALAFFLACLAGLPPGLAGLFAKVVVVRATLTGGAGWLAVLVAVNTVIGLAYYLRVAALLFREPTPAAEIASSDRTFATTPTVGDRVPRPVAVAIAVLAAVTVVLGFLPQLVLRLAPLATFG